MKEKSILSRKRRNKNNFKKEIENEMGKKKRKHLDNLREEGR